MSSMDDVCEENRNLRETILRMDGTYSRAMATMATLKKDAERYRWIRKNPTWIGFDADYMPEFIDRAVDESMQTKDSHDSKMR